ncbi:hypothetical protein Tco_0517908 [Tanacetum coccineum]
MEKEDPTIVTKSLANDFNDFIAKLGADQSNVSITNTTESSAANAKPASFAKIVQDKPIKKAVKITKLRNSEVVEGAVVAIPIEVVEEEGMESIMEHGPWLIRFVPLMLNVWTPNTDLKKDKIRRLLFG